MFLRVLAVLLLILQPLAAAARCGGTDLIKALPEQERAALRAAAARQPYAEGLLWQARRSATTITIFGTYHFRHPRTRAHLDRLAPLIDAADTVYLEVSNADQEKLQAELAADPSIMFITEGQTLPDLLGEADWQTYAAEMRARGVPGFVAAKFKPVWAAMMLGIGPCEAQGGAMLQAGIDKLIGKRAAQAGTPGRSLEDYRAVLDMLDGVPRATQLDMIRLFFDWGGDPDDMAYTLRRRYLAQEVALIWEFSRRVSRDHGGARAQEDFALLEDRLLTRRNRAWVDKLLQEARGGNHFVAVGAAHLPGRAGVLHLLDAAGYTLTRLPM